MSDIALQIERTIDGCAGASANVIFDAVVYSAENIAYNSATGLITLNRAGRYMLNWWVATQSPASANGAVFALSSSQGDYLKGNSPTKTGEVVGVGVICVATAPVTVSLLNTSGDTVCYAPTVPLTATLVVVADDLPAAGSTGGAGPATVEDGFCAFLPGVSACASTQLTGWNVSNPYYGSASFDQSAGSYTVPRTGTYAIAATINYSAAAPASLSLDAGIHPSFVVRRTFPVVTDLLGGLFPLLDVSVARVLTLRAILGSGSVAMAASVALTEGEIIGLFYEADGLTVPLELGGAGAPGIVWSVCRKS